MTTAAEAIETIRLALDAGPRPGPWEAEQLEEYNGWWTVADATGDCIDDSGDGGFEKRNAAYIAAANPESLRAILDRMAELERANAWQTIETAPKDGACYLATDGERQWVENTPPGCYPGVWELDKHGRWRGSTGDYEASFWRPLPSAPDAKEQA